MIRKLFEAEFDRQVENLIQKNYPQLAGMSSQEFTDIVAPLRTKLQKITITSDLVDGYLPFVIVIKNKLVPFEKMMSVIDFDGKSGFIDMNPVTPESFRVLGSLEIPQSLAYLMIDIDRGQDTLNVAPNQALGMIEELYRSPLTIYEGLSILTQHPEFLEKNNCFSLLGSRADDKKVPALWISSGRPRLGWCWEGNPHTWLGSASCMERIGV